MPRCDQLNEPQQREPFSSTTGSWGAVDNDVSLFTVTHNSIVTPPGPCQGQLIVSHCPAARRTPAAIAANLAARLRKQAPDAIAGRWVARPIEGSGSGCSCCRPTDRQPAIPSVAAIAAAARDAFNCGELFLDSRVPT